MNLDQIRNRLGDILASPVGPEVEAWKAAGRPVVGFTCSYVPLEVLTAAGALPLHLRGTGNHDTDVVDGLMSSRTCSYVRHVISLALDGRFDILDGVISLNTCDHVRRAADVWKHKTAIPYQDFISVPRNVRPSLFEFYRQEVENLLKNLQSHLGVSVSDGDLRSAIELHNGLRSKLAELDRFRASAQSQFNGADMLRTSVAARSLPPEEFLGLADELVQILKDSPAPDKPVRARLLLAGGELDEPEFVELIERQGALVAADTLCSGMRSHLSSVDPDSDDPLDAICRRYFFQTSCARMIGNFPDRVASLQDLVNQRSIDGVVFQRLKFCDPWGGEGHNLRHRFKGQDLPLLVLEREYGRLNGGQVSTRVQAFLEMIESQSLRRARAGGGGP